MKNCKITSFVFLFILIFLGLGTTDNDLYAQNKKNRARINADYVKVIGGEHYLNIKASARIDKKTVEKFGLVPDNHHNPKWYKIVLMPHVSIEKLSLFINDLKEQKQLEKIN